MNFTRFACRFLMKKSSKRKSTTILNRFYSRTELILGIETSCDDTGCAILDTNGNILGEALNSQHLIHLGNGGIIPPLAQHFHRENIENVVKEAVTKANVTFHDISAIATTVKPGLPMSLRIGMKYGKYLCGKYNKPFIPIHHMEAHALTARLHDKSLQFPFLVLLISGGHCLLAIAKDVNQFLLLGSTLDDAPGEAYDKLARRMKLRNIPEYSALTGGQAIELAASKASSPTEIEFRIPLLHYRDCNFSMSGLKAQVKKRIIREEEAHDLPPDAVLPNIENICAGFQLTLLRHLCHRVQRGMAYIETKELLQENNKTLVVSGGVACNNFIAKGLGILCEEMGYKLIRPPPKLCTDNGVMIGWNGVEKWKSNLDILHDFADIDIDQSAPFGLDIRQDVTRQSISCKWVKLTQLIK